MNALSKFIDADAIFFKSINYYQESEFLDDGDRTRGNICIHKLKGLQFVLNVKDHLGQKDFNFDIIFKGSHLGNDAANNPLISWNITPDFSKNNNSNVFNDVKGSDIDIEIVGISGSIVTVLTEVNPIIFESDCEGNSALSKVEMKTIQGEINYIEAEGKTSGVTATVKFNNLTIVSDARSAPVITSRIKAIRGKCGIGAAMEEVAKFTAIVEHTKPGEIVTYKWSVTGGGLFGTPSKAAPKGPVDQRNFNVQLVASSVGITVSVDIAVTDSSTGSIVYMQTHKFKYTPETAHSIKFKELACRIRSYTIFNMFVDPLLDPLKDYSTTPVERKEFDRLNKFAKTVLKDLTILSKLKQR